MQITQKLNPLLGSLKIIHPFHPLYGRHYNILEVKEVNGSRRYSLRTDSGVLCVPESWTDRQVERKQELDSHIIHFDAFTLKELAQLLKTLDDFSSVEVNPIGNSKQ
ncbi:MAG: hypothetical protein H7X94_15020 [Vallitaleaceae bacterium]|nr:hypothetical protein [Vallitaleaceae bacterium]